MTRHVARLSLSAAGLLLVAATAAPAQPLSDPKYQPRPAGPPVASARGLDVVPRDAFVFATLDVARLWEHPSLRPVRDFLSVSPGGEDPFARVLGVGLADVERATVFAAHPDWDEDVLVVALTTRQPYAKSAVLRRLGVSWNGPVQAKRSGNVVLPERGPFAAVVLADDRTLYYLVGSRYVRSRPYSPYNNPYGPQDENRALLTIGKLLARASDGPLADALAQAPAHAACVGLDVTQLADLVEREGGRPDPDFRALLKARTAVLTADLEPDGLKARVVLTFADPAAAKASVPAMEKLIEALATTVDREAKGEANRGEAGAAFVIFYRWLSWTLTTAKVQAEGNTVVATIAAPVNEMIVKVMAKLPKSLEASATATRTANNLKQIALAMHSYHDAMGRFPGNVSGFDGKPLLSWRVQLLPYLEQGPLYQQFRMNEPWDSPANRALLDRMPAVYAMPARPAPRNETYFRGFIGPRGTPWQHRPLFTEDDRFGARMSNITDGTANTLMVVEAGESVPWTKPDDLPYDGKMPLPKLGPPDGDRFWAVFCDGSVRQIRKGNEANVRAMITISGGEIVTGDD
jgi:hypothetical protein